MKFFPYLTYFLIFGFLCGGEPRLRTLPLWPDLAPGEVEGEVGPEEEKPPKPGEKGILRITNVSQPTLTVYPANPAKANGSAVLVCPGGGYGILAYEHEGTDVCQWLNEMGVTGILLKYRVPRRKDRPKHEAPLQDSQRALGLVRKHAKSWGINPSKLGILGFSAGGHLSVMTLTSFHERTYSRIDEADDLSCRPDFGILVYPAYLVDRTTRDSLFPEVVIRKDTPPCFFVHTGDDHVPAEGSALAYLALEKAGVVGNELHLFPFGGHGYGMRKTDRAVSEWPDRAESWMRASGWLD